uniref:BLOC-1-related complex subunit 8 n=1 Tax=Trichobilharzia regenti TaxID=157069 RepID=A0AA85J4Q3_TRIRE|nr:unnamed protein product [Trichobilharzia regenti]
MEKGVNFLFGKKDQSSNERSTMSTVVSCQKVTESTSSMLISLANQPSLAYFHIQEHIRKSTPEILRHQSKVEHLNSQIRGCCYDLDYALDVVQGMTKATKHFNRINELLKSSLFTKLQLDYAKMNALTNKDSQHRKPLLVNQGVSFESYSHPSHSNANANTAQGGTLSHLSNTVSTAAVQVREQAVNLTKRAMWTRSADISSSTMNILSSNTNTITSNNTNEMVVTAPKSANNSIEDKSA